MAAAAVLSPPRKNPPMTSAGAFDLTVPEYRPAEIKTYHKATYPRLAPEKSGFKGEGKTVLVTAGATGIGYSIAESFAKAGIAHLVIIQRRQEVLDEAKAKLGKEFPKLKITTYAASVTDYPKVSAILKEVGQIDVLIPNAAATHPMVPTKDLSTADLDNVFATNVTSPHYMISEFLKSPHTGPKTVIYVSSAAAQFAMATNSIYGASKAAANALITQFARDAAESDVVVQTYHPGAIATPLSKAAGIPDGMLEFEDVRLPGDFAVWLASPEAVFLSGRFVWAQWDVDDLLSLKGRTEKDDYFLTQSIVDVGNALPFSAGSAQRTEACAMLARAWSRMVQASEQNEADALEAMGKRVFGDALFQTAMMYAAMTA
nr:hypothetical protein B0A51_01944 [Rachicladosporium sp. CCFEE 5018]